MAFTWPNLCLWVVILCPQLKPKNLKNLKYLKPKKWQKNKFLPALVRSITYCQPITVCTVGYSRRQHVLGSSLLRFVLTRGRSHVLHRHQATGRTPTNHFPN